MRIAIAHSFYRLPGGEDSYVRKLEPLLGERHDLLMLTRDNSDLRSTAAAASAMTFSLKNRRSATQALHAFRPDVIHLHNPYPSWGPSVHLAARALRIPVVMTVHNFRLRCPNGYMFTEGALCSRCVDGNHANAVIHKCFPNRGQAVTYAAALWLHRFILRTERDLSRLVTPSLFMRDMVLSWGIEPQRVDVVRNFCERDEHASAVPGEFGLYAGRLSSEKGLTVLLKGLKLAGDPPFKIAGDGPLMGALIALQGQLGLKNTEFLGHLDRDRLMAVMRRARYVAFPSSWNENAPIAAAEALAAGRPLIVTDRGGLPELVRDSRGLCVPADDADQLSRAIGRMNTDFDCRNAGENAMAFHRSELTPEKHLSQLEIVLRAAAEGHPVSSS